MGKVSLVEDEQPLALRGGGDSRINNRIRTKKATIAEISRRRDEQWQEMLDDISSEDSSSDESSSATSSAIGESDSDGMSIDSSTGHVEGVDRGPGMGSGDSKCHPGSVNKLVSSPQQLKGASKGKRTQLQSPPESNRIWKNQAPNIQSTPEPAPKHPSTANPNKETPEPI